MLITCTPKEENIVGDRTKVVTMMQVLGPWILSFFLRRRQWTSFFLGNERRAGFGVPNGDDQAQTRPPAD